MWGILLCNYRLVRCYTRVSREEVRIRIIRFFPRNPSGFSGSISMRSWNKHYHDSVCFHFKYNINRTNLRLVRFSIGRINNNLWLLLIIDPSLIIYKMPHYVGHFTLYLPSCTTLGALKCPTMWGILLCADRLVRHCARHKMTHYVGHFTLRAPSYTTLDRARMIRICISRFFRETLRVSRDQLE